MVLFETKRLKIIRYTVKRLSDIYRLYNDEDIIEYALPDRKGKTREELVNGIKAYNKMYLSTKNAQGRWLITDKVTNEVIGFTGLFYIDEIGKTELSYSILKSYRRKGFATECAAGIKKYAFEKLNLKDVCALIRHDNPASEKVALGIGMTCTIDTVQLWGFTFKLYEISNYDI